jgi:hypothetical protein
VVTDVTIGVVKQLITKRCSMASSNLHSTLGTNPAIHIGNSLPWSF